jgi:hypothetical protein
MPHKPKITGRKKEASRSVLQEVLIGRPYQSGSRGSKISLTLLHKTFLRYVQRREIYEAMAALAYRRVPTMLSTRGHATCMGLQRAELD